jgi:hypothetical protein
MRIVKYIVELSTSDYNSNPTLHEYPTETLDNIVRMLVPIKDWEVMKHRVGETIIVNGMSHNVIARDFEGSCGGCCFYDKKCCCDVIPCRSSERADGRDVYFQPWQKS